MIWAHCIARDRAERDVWRCDLRRSEHFPDDLMARLLGDPNVASIHIGTRRSYAPWWWNCHTIAAPEDWPRQSVKQNS